MVMRYHLGLGVGHIYQTNGHRSGASEGLKSMDEDDDMDMQDDETTAGDMPLDGNGDGGDSDGSDSNGPDWEEEEEEDCSDRELAAMDEMYGC